MAEKNVLFVVGSLREGSFNRALAETAAGMLEERVAVAYLDYADVPFMNQDIEFPPPESVTRVRGEVMAADAAWFFTPEYNHDIPAQLKNLLDWLGRPLVARDYATPMPLTGKPVAIAGAGGQAGTADCRAGLERLLLRLGACPVDGVGEGFPLPAQAWKSGVYEPSQDDRARLAAQADALIAALQGAM